MGRNLVMAIYSHPEYYPPTLNAIDQLAPHYDSIYLLHRNVFGFDWVYPENVFLVGPDKLHSAREVEKGGYFKKLGWFLAFCLSFLKLVRKQKAHTILLYDCIPVLAYRLTRFFFDKPQVLWYHNHDVADQNYIRKYSIYWFAWKSEQWIFPLLNIFSLPAIERKVFFPLDRLLGKFVFIPNYPSLKRYGTSEKFIDQELDILYQGSIGPLHGLEEIIPILGSKIGGYSFRLILKGFVREEYLLKLKQIANNHNVEGKLVYLPPSGYNEVIENAKRCHIGIGIFKKQDIMNNTLGTASNKIYEYAAAGLSVLLYDNEHFRAALSKCQWVFFTDTTPDSLSGSLQEIVEKISLLSQAAQKDFTDKYCFELYFKDVFPLINA